MTLDEQIKQIANPPAKLTIESRGGKTKVEMTGEARTLAWMLTKGFSSILSQIPDKDLVLALAYATRNAMDKEVTHRMAMLDGEKEPDAEVEIHGEDKDKMIGLLDKILGAVMGEKNGE